MRRSFLYAAALVVVVLVWMASGRLGAQAPDATAGQGSEQAFPVEARWYSAQTYTDRIIVRGRAEALRAVWLASQIEASVAETPVERGTQVAEGDLVCRLHAGEIPARIDEARALLEQRKLEMEGSEELLAKGNRSRTQAAQARAAYEAAKAQLAMWEVQLYHTRLRAPFAGRVEDRPAEVGDLLLKGGRCARILQIDPFLMIGEVSEEQVLKLAPGDAAEIALTAGQRLTGTLRYVAATATERTRTYRIEVTVENPGGLLREGLSGDIVIAVDETQAHRLPASALVLNSAGELGVRAIDEQDRTVFHPVTLLGDPAAAVWVDGLPERVQVITAGQDFVADGEPVRVLTDGADG
ncbi:MAG: efflux RND transporter periplasmic adaptor subunit [Rhodothalassiaceae bacterium]